jgi:diaminohydroxyphosphoribosylaminopyrimidine deaminase/5-amino-6-(5-phosphoribosylamino)uracil reductase
MAALRAAGVAVETGDGRADAAAARRPYLKHRRTGRPWVIAKFAASLDGRTATATGDSRWITGEAARELVHQQRAWVDAILAGSGTVTADDPALTARPGGAIARRQPVRVIVSASASVPATARLFREPGKTIVATVAPAPASWRAEITATGAQLVECEPGPGGVNLRQLLDVLGGRGVMSLWVEGGSTLLGSLFDEDLVDEVWAFIAPLIIGGSGAVPAVAGQGARTIADAWRLVDPAVQEVGGDVLIRGLTRPFSL